MPVPFSAPLPPTLHEKLLWVERFSSLGNSFYTEVNPQPLPSPGWVAQSPDVAQLLGWPEDWWCAPSALSVFSGNACWPGMHPRASVYSGHQFGLWAGQLGDGRALSLGEALSPTGPLEIQLKGAGPTPYSRGADGRAVLRSSVREFLCSEAMAGLGIPSTRALCLVGSPLEVQREKMETAAVLTRVAPSFVRFGHFEHFASRQKLLDLKILADFVINHHAPHCNLEAQPYLALLDWVTQSTASLVAQWQTVGFCHGVMNTDNMSILGLTIDYGPFGFLDIFDPHHVCNHSDHQGRYAYDQQPSVAHWNCLALGQAMLPLVQDKDAVRDVVDQFPHHYHHHAMQRWRAKLGLASAEEKDQELIQDLLALLATHRVDFTIFFRRLSLFDACPGKPNPLLDSMFSHPQAFAAWALLYRSRLEREPKDNIAPRIQRMNLCNPLVVLRNHLAEKAIEQAQKGDTSEIKQLLTALTQPFCDTVTGVSPQAIARYADFPPPWAAHIEVSCSS